MSRYTNGWTWADKATADQTENRINEAACSRLYRELVDLYNSIPDPQSDSTADRLDAVYENAYETAGSVTEEDARAAAEAAVQAVKDRTQQTWGEIEALEQMLAQRGARLKEDFEEHNEHAALYRHADARAECRSR